MSDDLRSAIESAISTNETADDQVVESAPEAEPVEASDPVVEAKHSRSRDDGGRFAKAEKAGKPQQGIAKEVTPEAVIAPEKASPKEQVVTQAAEPVKAPQAFKPLAREDWARTPASVQSEIQRREQEINRVMQEASQARELADGLREVMEPYMGMIRADGGDALGAIDNLFRSAAALRTGHPQQRAAVAAQMIKTFGIDIGMLDNALAGVGVQPQQGQQQPFVDPSAIAKQAKEALKAELMEERQRVDRQKADVELEKWSEGREWFADIRDEMADVMELAMRRGVSLTLDDAYNRVCQMHPEIAQVLEQRKAAANAANAQASTQRSRAAASSVRSSPAAAIEGAQPESLREQIQAAMAAASGR